METMFRTAPKFPGDHSKSQGDTNSASVGFFAIAVVAFTPLCVSLRVCFCVMPVGNFSSDLHSETASVNNLK